MFEVRTNAKRAQRAGVEVLIAASLSVVSGAQAVAAPADKEASYTFAFHEAPTAQVAEEILGELGLPYTIDPSVTERISFRIDQRLTRAQLLQAFESVMAANNIALVRDGEALVLTSTARAKSVAGVRTADSGARGVGYEVVAVPLSYAIPSEVAKALEAISDKGQVVYASDKLGLVILGGNGAELQATLETIKVFDQSRLESSKIRWFELSQAPAAQVARELEGMFSAAGAGGVTVVPLKRLNGLIMFGRTTEALEQASQWVFRLDTPTRDAASSLWVYHPQNTSAEALSRTLNAIAMGQQAVAESTMRRPGVANGDTEATTSTAVSLPLGDQGEDAVRTAVHKETNTLLVSAPAWQWTRFQRVLSEIDRPQGQLLIEATILEVTLNNEFRLGVDWSVLAASGNLQIASNQNAAGRIGPRYPGFSITFLDTDVQAAINTLSDRTSIEVLSAPKVVTLDNHPARLEVGDQVPIVTQRSQSTETANGPLINSIDYRNSGVILNVTPRISGGNRIVLDVNQEVSAAVKTETSDIDSPTIQQRKLESTLVLTDGGVVALGGLISRTRSRGESGVPGLMDVPGLGALFRTTTRDEKRTELIVLLSARIIRDGAGADRATADLRADMLEIQRRGLLNELQ
ncbi:type II secretion system secretin GspD [Phenylobacterium sp.]|uniref:type II secretion system secretin GspD n=1 Tax=Phenylobacterium sp. TaxID=1871053 RepID=UPI00289B9871|nr:type II secretion system secretin GspD [Phenylobacterium sp.]